MIGVQDVKDIANFYGITVYDLFWLAFVWRYKHIPDQFTIQYDYKQFVVAKKIPNYICQFVNENPLIDDNGTLIEKWLPLLEQLKSKITGGDQFASTVRS